jgi:GST-like protein
LVLFESGAILLYLAAKTGRFMPAGAVEKWNATQWLVWQMGSVGPNFGQAFHFMHQHPEDTPAEEVLCGRERYIGEVQRLCTVMDDRLAVSEFLSGPEYSIADIATYPWIALHRWFDIDLAVMPNLQRWYLKIGSRPAVLRGMDVPARDQMEQHAR